MGIEKALVDTGLAEYGDGPSAGTQHGDLTQFKFKSGDSFVSNFRGHEILFTRVAHDLMPGEFVYKEPVAPHLEINFKIASNGLVGLRVKCGRDVTSRFTFQLHPNDRSLPYVRYDVESAGRGTLKRFLRRVRRFCPTKRLITGDLPQVLSATDKTIYVPFEGGRLGLTKV
ncbi:hypothetical protein FOZ61_010954 [Perkinsus olseni]|uniref:Uncharacterized protein n=1 Tax=Perkinsus olseni TaxID=32597 RepID=A0A7J6MK26_PEROL|nr:hypothetical protein FOZ61_010954 [Perkinsus olseni]KAF4671796.1 hypothetical protein FOL46_009880 [Perkinsus olseni]